MSSTSVAAGAAAPNGAQDVPLVLPAEITHEQGRTALAMLSQAIHTQREGAVVLDGSRLERFDSTALAVVLACRRAVLAQGRGFAVRNLPADVQELANLYGVQELLGGAAAPGAASAQGGV